MKNKHSEKVESPKPCPLPALSAPAKERRTWYRRQSTNKPHQSEKIATQAGKSKEATLHRHHQIVQAKLCTRNRKTATEGGKS
jgi:hypothetical protein